MSLFLCIFIHVCVSIHVYLHSCVSISVSLHPCVPPLCVSLSLCVSIPLYLLGFNSSKNPLKGQISSSSCEDNPFVSMRTVDVFPWFHLTHLSSPDQKLVRNFYWQDTRPNQDKGVVGNKTLLTLALFLFISNSNINLCYCYSLVFWKHMKDLRYQYIPLPFIYQSQINDNDLRK